MAYSQKIYIECVRYYHPLDKRNVKSQVTNEQFFLMDILQNTAQKIDFVKKNPKKGTQMK